jgi:rubrerythrin
VSTKPSYLGLLNAVALAETRAHGHLTAWAAVTPSPDVRRVLLTVAAREGEHGMSFAKRLNELGFEVRPKNDPELESKMAIARSDRSDLEKMELLGFGDVDPDAPDIFDGFFNDHSIDVRTGELLGRYIAEERDSGRLLRSCYRQLRQAAGLDRSPAARESATEQLARLDAKVDAVCRSVEELREIVCAQTMPTDAAP